MTKLPRWAVYAIVCAPAILLPLLIWLHVSTRALEFTPVVRIELPESVAYEAPPALEPAPAPTRKPHRRATAPSPEITPVPEPEPTLTVESPQPEATEEFGTITPYPEYQGGWLEQATEEPPRL